MLQVEEHALESGPTVMLYHNLAEAASPIVLYVDIEDVYSSFILIVRVCSTITWHLSDMLREIAEIEVAGRCKLGPCLRAARFFAVAEVGKVDVVAFTTLSISDDYCDVLDCEIARWFHCGGSIAIIGRNHIRRDGHLLCWFALKCFCLTVFTSWRRWSLVESAYFRSLRWGFVQKVGRGKSEMDKSSK